MTRRDTRSLLVKVKIAINSLTNRGPIRLSPERIHAIEPIPTRIGVRSLVVRMATTRPTNRAQHTRSTRWHYVLFFPTCLTCASDSNRSTREVATVTTVTGVTQIGNCLRQNSGTRVQNTEMGTGGRVVSKIKVGIVQWSDRVQDLICRISPPLIHLPYRLLILSWLIRNLL